MEIEFQKLKVKVKTIKWGPPDYFVSYSDISEYEVGSSDTIQSLQAKIKESQGIDEKDQHLGVHIYTPLSQRSRSFRPNWTFEEASIKDGDTIELHIRERGWRLYFKSLNGQVYEIDSDSRDTIWHVKGLIQEKTGCPVEKQRIVYAGRQCGDEEKVGDYLTKDTTLTLILQKELLLTKKC